MIRNANVLRKTFLIVLSFVLFFQIPLFRGHAETLRYAVVSPVINVRNAASTLADIVYVIETSGEYLILSESKDTENKLWYKIQINNSLNGFIASWVIDSVRSSEKETMVEGIVAVIDPGVKIRIRPSLNAPIHKITSVQIKLPVNAEIKDENNRTWYKIQIDGQVAWVASWVVIVQSVKNEKTSASDKLIVCEAVNLRKGPGTEFSVVSYIASHIEARGIYEEKDTDNKTWYYIRLPNNIEGWVAGWVVKVQQWSDQKEQVTNKFCCIAPVVNIRSGPSTSASIVAVVDKYGEFEVLNQGKDVNGKIWYEIRLDSGTGWVAGWVVVLKNTGNSNETLTAVNVRSGPGTNFDKLFEIPANTSFTVQGISIDNKNDIWYEILMGGKTGWIYGKLVSVKNSPEVDRESLNQEITLQNTIPIPIYLGPGEAYKKDKELPESAGLVTIEAISNNSHKEIWYKVFNKKYSGWIHEKWIDFSGSSPENNVPQYTIQSISWTKKTHGISMLLTLDIEGLYKFEGFQLTEPSRSIIEIKNCKLYQEESLLLVNTNGIKQIHAFQFSTNPNIVRIAVECETDMRYVSERKENKLVFEFADYDNYTGPKLIINGKELENQLLLKEYKSHLYVPLHEFAQTIGGFISWDNSSQRATLQVGNRTYRFESEDKNVYVKATREDRIAINNPIKTFSSTLYLPVVDLGTIFNSSLYSLGNNYYVDNRLNNILFETKSSDTCIFTFDFAFPLTNTLTESSQEATFTFLNTTLSSSLKPPNSQVWVKANSYQRTQDNPSSSIIVLSKQSHQNIETAVIQSENRLIVTMKSDQQKGLKGRTIILDPGHGSFTQDGYYDAGAIGPTGLLESAVNLKIALKLKTLLEEKGAVVIITRSQEQDKQSPTLKDRIKDANASGADLFLSIHQNASINHKLKGIQSFFWNNSSAKIASFLANSISKSTGLSINKVDKRSFAVTENITSMPSLLIETACLSNPEEEKMLQSDNFLLLIAEGLTNGIEQFFNN